MRRRRLRSLRPVLALLGAAAASTAWLRVGPAVAALLPGRLPLAAARPARRHRGRGVAAARKATSVAKPLEPLKALIVGAGPSGLLLAHRLLDAGARVELVEGRVDPRKDAAALEGRAYALGLGIRGRTAIRTAGDSLWDSILPNGFGSERFKLHVSPSFSIDLRTPEDNEGLEPSLLVYQTDLCGAMLQELEARYASTGRLSTSFGTFVESVDPIAGTAAVKQPGAGGQRRDLGPVDLIAGCDGVNSVVRAAVARACAGFQADLTSLPGFLKVLRFNAMPATLDPTAVHAIPGAGGTSAFIEPTARGACALINWRQPSAEATSGEQDSSSTVSLGTLDDPAKARDALAERFPLLRDVLDLDAGRQFVEQQPARAATVKCNTYHFGTAALLGDAAHSTGGASGQGCNSALQDSAVLADLLQEHAGDVPAALLAYSQQRVPEGQALLDLSLGPGESAGPLRRGLYGLATLRDTVLGRLKLGEPPLQTQLTTTLTPFSEIRRKRDFFFGDFPTAADFKSSIAALAGAGAAGGGLAS